MRVTAFAEDASRIRKNPDIVARLRSFAYNLLRADGCDTIKFARWRHLDIDTLFKIAGYAKNWTALEGNRSSFGITNLFALSRYEIESSQRRKHSLVSIRD